MRLFLGSAPSDRTRLMKKLVSCMAATFGAAVAVVGCGSSQSASGPARLSRLPISGPGLTSPTAPSGAKTLGGTVYFTELPGEAPNYIFPMTSAQVATTANISQLNALLYRPLYWYGNNYSPTVDYNYSIGQPPQMSNGDRTVTVKLNPWKWSDGEMVTSRDIEFWINLMKASPGTEWCCGVPGFFPDNIKSMSAPNPSTIILNLKRAYNPEWLLYNELSQIYPIPLAWDRTSLSQPAPRSDNGHLPDTTNAAAVYAFLDTQSKKLGTWASSPLWEVVDGPFKLQSFTTEGELTMVPNVDYSGSPKPTISKFVELPFTSDTAVYNEMRSGGPSAITIGSLPPQYAPQIAALTSAGFIDNPAAAYAISFIPLNFHNPSVGPIFSQLYIRQALQHLVDQQGWINAFLYRKALPTISPIPQAPTSPLASIGLSASPIPFSVSAASRLLTSNGWKVAPGGSTTCIKPGTGAGDCGAGIRKGERISFDIDYASGISTVESEMVELAAEAKKVGIRISLTSHPVNTVIGSAVACSPTQADCRWTALNWGGEFFYGPEFLPTGEDLYALNAPINFGSYSDPVATRLINATIFDRGGQEHQALTAYARYMAAQVPTLFIPTSIGSYQAAAGTLVAKNLGGYAANAFGYMNPEDWYFTK